ncbi:MAG: ParB/RepB/Spo0J family partition protein [Dysgonamonadaceae bacterium]|jgi:ParB family chromosome partitioning protein|nr:ParB/RepB/Spo0J family partition protein [Dysgonamonadaceae bacterium]
MSIKKVNSTENVETKGIVSVELIKIVTGDFNPRKSVNESELTELAESIKQVGILQPVLVRPKGRKFEIVCGERRFRASVLADTKTIPAIVRKMSDDEALEAAITENLCRVDVSPIEEAAAYKRLADTGRYSVESLAVRFGKSETYIRNRMRLNELTDEILDLVTGDGISMTVALELCKYSADVQSDVYEKHLSGKLASYYGDWRNLTAREFVSRLENDYCNGLSRYRFDKSECAKCPFNTNCYSLFSDGEGRCSNLFCLREKNRRYLVEACKSAIEKCPGMEIGQPSYGTAENDGVFAELSEQGYAVSKTHINRYPRKPEEPKAENFGNRAEYEEAQSGYYSRYAEYTEAGDGVEQLFLDGKAQPVVTVNASEVITGYVLLPDEETQAPAGEADAIRKLEKQDTRNREIAVENIVDDTRKYIRETEIPQSDFTEFEDRLLYFAMLEDLKRKHFALFTEDSDRWHLSDEEKITIINNLKEEQKTVIRRDFLVKHLSDAFGVSKKSCLMLEFARLHFPEVLTETKSKYNEIYTKRHERIMERLTALKSGVQEVA